MNSNLSSEYEEGRADESSRRRCSASSVLFSLYRWRVFRPIVRRALRSQEGGEFYSATLRDIFARYYGVRVGAYSYGPCLTPGAFPAGVDIGRYVSIAQGVQVFLRNHPTDRLSTHPFFFNRELGFFDQDTIETGKLSIGHDAWIGTNALIMAGCNRIGIGSVIGAGAIVTKDVPDFAIVAGNPAKLIRYRFSGDICEQILADRWWAHPIEELATHLDDFSAGLPEKLINHVFVASGYQKLRRRAPETMKDKERG